jgi:DNA-binding MarR family transcriptional regulator
MDAPDQHTIATCTRAWQTLRMAHNRVANRLDAELSRECAIALNEFDVLFYLHSHSQEEVRITTLLDAVSLSQPALSRLIARLEDRGLIIRTPAADDGRAFVVSLTGAGTALTDRAIAIHARVVHETLTGKFTDAEQAALLQTLSQIGG